MEADGYAFYSDEEDDGYGGWEYVGGDSDSVVAPAATPPLQLTGISPDSAYAGDPLAISLQGTCTGANPTVTTDASDITIVSQVSSSIIYLGIVCGYTEFINVRVLIDQAQPAGVVHFIVTNPTNGTSDSEPFTVLSLTSMPPTSPPPAPPVSCSVGLTSGNPSWGYSAIVPTGLSPGGTGTITVSFSGAAFASVSQTVKYGPYSTPSSIASSIAALITHYFAHTKGLYAQSIGPIIMYRATGNANIGTVSLATTGNTFAMDPSVTAAEAAGGCPPPQAPLQERHPIVRATILWYPAVTPEDCLRLC